MSDQPVPKSMTGPLRRPDQSFGVVCEFETEAEARAFTALVGGHFVVSTQARDAPQVHWHDLAGRFANTERQPPDAPILVKAVSTSSDGWVRVDYLSEWGLVVEGP